MKKVRVLIVEDSKVVREYLEHIISHDSRLEIAGAVETGEEALRIMAQVAPDVVSVDIRLPGMNGFELTRRIMCERPTPVVVVAASVDREGSQITMEALRAGALTVLEKPAGLLSKDYAVVAERLCTQLVIMSEVKLVTRNSSSRLPSPVMAPSFPRAPLHHAPFRMLGIVCSTGGPNALVPLLTGIGADFPLPILLVQHIAPDFLEGFAAWLGTVCPFPVEIVRTDSVALPGTIYVAAADHHLRVDGNRLRVDCDAAISGQRPSGSVLFESMGTALGSAALGVLLTGMGDDGAEGLLRLQKSRGYTIAEDESTAVVYGMPAEAVRLGAVIESLPLPAIAPRILALTSAERGVIR